MKIRKHDFVLIDDELKCRLHKVVDMKIKIKKNYLNLIFLVNKKYGSTYTYVNNKWVRSKKKKNKLEIDFQGDIKGTNKDIFQNANSQKLTEENILELKENTNENPYQVIKQLVDNSSTYKDKTVISKFKYIEKKLKRHLCQFTVYECSIVNLVNFYYKYFPEKISSVRVDYLSYMLFHLNRDVLLPWEGDSQGGGERAEGEESTQMFSEDTEKFDANPTANHLHTFSTRKPNVIIYDDSFGLLTSTLNIVYAHHVNIFSLIYKNASNSIIPSFGIPKSANIAKVSILHASHATRLNTGEWLAIDGRCELIGKGGEAREAVEVGEAAQVGDAPEGECRKRRMNQVDHVGNLPCPAADQTADPTTDAAPPTNKRAKNAHEDEADEGDKADEVHSTIAPDHPPQLQHMLIDHMNSRGAEAFVAIISSDFIYSTNTDVCLLVDTLINVALKFLKNDSKLIIHTDDLNLSSLFLKGLMDTGSFINVKLNEFLLREQQVVKRRTHPVIKNAKLGDGFLLTALKVEGAA
ncbi:tRNA (adenine(58)-N(1))-methyltransferase non-catalytic subunit TRM6, putative [Plasmodium vivax]|uniref:tRNA (adenine(58)-N(1))-methyltransferase non-catalytic subunit TRM6 n=1 Tax=Plasmodium vivax TaxID=5855 RepID=A0A564ZUE0_PLAVI|nr:tRNA (adenine(58)-N(1))-methyltransferase non-catalytic subunit TRM6, putative [Plasmodium vivax]